MHLHVVHPETEVVHVSGEAAQPRAVEGVIVAQAQADAVESSSGRRVGQHERIGVEQAASGQAHRGTRHGHHPRVRLERQRRLR